VKIVSAVRSLAFPTVIDSLLYILQVFVLTVPLKDGSLQISLIECMSVDAYIAAPTVDYPKDAVILFPTDFFGI